MNRCTWCNQPLWPMQRKSPGGTMHQTCFDQVNIISRETQRQYQQARPKTQAELRWEEEDRL